MRLRPALFAVPMAVVIAWFVVRAEQQNPPNAGSVPMDSAQVAAITAEISQRSEHLKPMLEEVHATDWLAKGAPQAYVSQWSSLREQNQLIEADMAEIGQPGATLPQILKALFRIHRFDGDLDALLGGLRRYQNPALADLIESVAAGDQNGVEQLQQYVLDLTNEKERLLDVEDKEAQRCRSQLATQPPKKK
jgi:hypothetical protein